MPHAHSCHWPGCQVEISPSLFCCRAHWFTLPKPLRQAIWRTYRRGQEHDKNPSDEYIAAALEAVKWAHEYERRRRPLADPFEIEIVKAG